MFPHIAQVDSRIRASEKFPRIRDAEAKINRNKDTSEKVSKKRSKNKAEEKTDSLRSLDFFSKYTINKDTSCSKYMPFDEVIYPKVFNPVDIPVAAIDHLWMAGFLDKASRDHKAEYKNHVKLLTEMPDSVVLPHVAEKLRNMSRSGSADNKKVGQETDQLKGLTIEDEYKLQNFSKRARAKKKLKSSKFAILQPYVDANNRLLNARMHLKPVKQQFLASDLHKIFENEQKEHFAAIIIQRMWRRPIPLRKFRFTVLCMLMAVRIQRFVRGMIARKWVALWIVYREKFTLLWQSRIRRWLSNIHWNKQLKIETVACINIQRIVRGRIGRSKFIKYKLDMNALKIQKVWRGILGRTKADRIWLNKSIIIIQRFARRLVSKKRFIKERQILVDAVLKVQNCFRGWISNKEVMSRLYTRETIYRDDQMAVLTSEEEYLEDRIMKLADRLTKKEIKQKLLTLVNEQQTTFKDIIQLEHDYAETRRQINSLSPRAIQQGWKKESEATAIKLRTQLTALKCESLFHLGLKVKKLEEVYVLKIEELEDIARGCRMVSDCRESEVYQNRLRAFYHDTKLEKKMKKQAIADEKRKWALKFYNSDGKPDRKRRPGRPWDPSILAGDEKATYCAGHDVDLAALSEYRTADKSRIAPKKAVDSMLAKLSLQTYLLQVDQYERLLNPIYDIMQQNMGGGGGPMKRPQSTPTDIREQPQGRVEVPRMGWGQEQDAELQAAMRNIGAIPTSPTRKKAKEIPKRNYSAATNVEKQRKNDLIVLRTGTPDVAAQSIAERSDKNSEEKTSVRKSTRKDSKLRSDIKSKYALVPTSNSGYKELDDESLADETMTSSTWTEHKAMEVEKKVTQQREEPYRAKRKERLRARRRDPAVIPWALLDELDGEKKKFEVERQYVEVSSKY